MAGPPHSPDTVSLAAQDAALSLSLARGGAILGWHRAGRPVLREPTLAALAAGDARGLACYPLVPYSNRIDHGAFDFDGQTYRLAVQPRDRPHAIHGVGWDSDWTLAFAGPAAATLALDHPGDTRWPFPFAAEQTFALARDRLSVTIEIENRGEGRMPAGLGLHPFFPRAEGARLRFAAASAWEAAPDLLPSRRVPATGRWNHAEGRPLGPEAFDNCFNGWHGPVRIDYPDGRCITLSADPLFGHLVVYVPAGETYFAVEPVSHMNDGLNHREEPDHGVRILDPGESLGGEIVFELAGW